MNNTTTRIGILLIEDFALMSYANVIEPLRAANMLSQKPLYDIRHFSSSNESQIASSSGAIIPTEIIYDTDPAELDIDYLFVIAGGDPFEFEDKKTLGWLRRIARTDVTLAGVSGGPVILAKAGLMQGYQMTVHWQHEKKLIHDMPLLDVRRTLYVIDRDRLSCAGGTAPGDMMYAVLAHQHGHDFALQVSDWFMHTNIRPDIGQQKSGIIQRFGTYNHAVIRAIEAMQKNISDPLSQDKLSRYCGVSLRQLQRAFIRELGVPPMTFYRDLRLEHAAKLLEQTPKRAVEIAFETGFSSSSHFSSNFIKKYGVKPLVYRANYRTDKILSKEPE